MQEIKAKIIQQRNENFEFRISEDKTTEFQINIECKVNMKTPQYKEDKTVLLNLELIINTKDDSLKITFISDFVFELDSLPDDYTELAEDTLAPMAREKLLNDLDKMLIDLGYNKMELAKKIKDN